MTTNSGRVTKRFDCPLKKSSKGKYAPSDTYVPSKKHKGRQNSENRT